MRLGSPKEITMAIPDSGVRIATRQDIQQMIDAGERFVLVDVLPHEHFQRIHLPGAINIPINLLREVAPLVLGKVDRIVVYCTNEQCQLGVTAAKMLLQLGFQDVLDYRGGILDWQQAGLPVMRDEGSPITPEVHRADKAS